MAPASGAASHTSSDGIPTFLPGEHVTLTLDLPPPPRAPAAGGAADEASVVFVVVDKSLLDVAPVDDPQVGAGIGKFGSSF